MSDKSLMKEFEEVQAKYKELMLKLVEMKIPATLDPVAAACNVGEWCCTGTERVRDRMSEIVLPDKSRR